MIHGIGNDIIAIKRIEKAIKRHGERMLDRLFTRREQLYCNKYKDSARHYAGRFAAKEAISKALGTGFRNGLSLLDIEILNDANGKPQVFLSPLFEKEFQSPQILLSISHCHEYASAVAIRISMKDSQSKW